MQVLWVFGFEGWIFGGGGGYLGFFVGFGFVWVFYHHLLSSYLSIFVIN